MRRNRVKKKGSTYETTATINRFQEELAENEVKDIMIEVLNESKLIFNYILFDFSIQDNCVKFIIKPFKDSDLSKIMQWILSVFAIRFNKHFDLHGHVWYDRFKSRIIETVEEVKKCIEKLKDFPVIKKIVTKAVDYVYGGAYYLERKIYRLVEPFRLEIFLNMNL